ncbi:MAG: hypothetical protein Q8Q09_22855 [Deltaproteobacteria bacterium]|nr:hypothetical protein [Deltaproteobacteria bacterium]
MVPLLIEKLRDFAAQSALIVVGGGATVQGDHAQGEGDGLTKALTGPDAGWYWGGYHWWCDAEEAHWQGIYLEYEPVTARGPDRAHSTWMARGQWDGPGFWGCVRRYDSEESEDDPIEQWSLEQFLLTPL